MLDDSGPVPESQRPTVPREFCEMGRPRRSESASKLPGAARRAGTGVRRCVRCRPESVRRPIRGAPASPVRRRQPALLYWPARPVSSGEPLRRWLPGPPRRRSPTSRNPLPARSRRRFARADPQPARASEFLVLEAIARSSARAVSSATTATLGLNSAIWWASSSTFRPATSA